MKKLFPLFVIFLFALSLISANTPDLPYTLHGKASIESGECISGFNIKISALDFGKYPFEEKTIEVPVNEHCEYNFALGNPPLTKWMNGMEITLTFCKYDESCIKTLVIGEGGCESGGGCSLDFVLKPTSIVITDEGEKEAKEVIKIIETVEVETEGEISWVWKSIIGLAIAILALFGWSKGFTALAKYYWNKGEELRKAGHPKLAKPYYNRAIKMLKTALKRAAEGYYKK